MPVADVFPNLPGFVAQIQDTNLRIPPTQQTPTQSVLLFGTATDGPTNTPIQIASIADGQRLYGTTAAATTMSGQAALQKNLIRGAYELLQAGCSDIRLCRVGGTNATLALSDSASANAITLTAGYAGVKYGTGTAGLSASVVVAPASAAAITITTLDGVAHAIKFTPGTTLVGDLVNAVNTSNLNVTASVGPTATLTALATPTALATTYFNGGSDGTNPTDAQYSDALSAAYGQLENYGFSVAVPLGAYLQTSKSYDGSGNLTISNANSGDTVFFGLNLAQFVAKVAISTQSCFGVIAVTPLAVPTFLAVNQRGTALASTSYTFQYSGAYSPSAGPAAGAVVGTDGTIVDIGYLLNVVAGPDVIVNNPLVGTYVMDGAATYAGRVVSLSPQSAATNKPLSSALGLAYNFGPSVLNTLVGQRFVAFAFANGSVRVIADQTYSLGGHDFTKLSTLRVTYAAMEAVRNATSRFIGEASTPAAYNNMGTAVQGALKAMKIAGALLDYSYNINATAQQQINGQVTIDLVLVPALQIRKILVTISLQPAGTISVSGSSSSS